MKPSPDHVQHVLQRERELASWIFAPHRDEQERVQTRMALQRLNDRRNLQNELPLDAAGAESP